MPDPVEPPTESYSDDEHRLTPEKRADFLRIYASGKSVEYAANEIGFSRTAIFNLIDRDEAFADAYERAQKRNTTALEDHLMKHATEPKTPGNIIALFGLLKARNPGRWRENVKLEHSGTVAHALAPDLLAAARERLEKRDVIDADEKPTAANGSANGKGAPNH